jgi:hypothetical protein
MERTAIIITTIVAVAILGLVGIIGVIVKQQSDLDVKRMTACVDSGGQWLPARGRDGVFQCEKAVTMP